MSAAFTPPLTITETFCSAGDKVLPSATSIPTMANQVDGFPISQANTVENDGLPVKRLEMNGVFNLYTQHILWNQVGGQYTFDPLIANAGGYNKGSILAYYNVDGTFNTYLCSSKDNNTDNFITTPSVIGTSWISIMASYFPDIIDNVTTGEVVIGGRIINNRIALISINDDNLQYSTVDLKHAAGQCELDLLIFKNGALNNGIVIYPDQRPQISGDLTVLTKTNSQSIATLGDMSIQSGSSWICQTVGSVKYLSGTTNLAFSSGNTTYVLPATMSYYSSAITILADPTTAAGIISTYIQGNVMFIQGDVPQGVHKVNYFVMGLA